MKAVVATFIAHDDDEADDILDSLGMLAENDSYTLYMTGTRNVTSEERTNGSGRIGVR